MNEIFNQLGVESGLLFQRDKLSYEELKFAELIVLKCSEIADTAEPFLASDLIKKHFGVEEND